MDWCDIFDLFYSCLNEIKLYYAQPPLSARTFIASEHGSGARLHNHLVLTNIPPSAENRICMFVFV